MDIRTLVQSAGAAVTSGASASGTNTTSATPTFTPRTVETESLKVKGSSGFKA